MAVLAENALSVRRHIRRRGLNGEDRQTVKQGMQLSQAG